MTSFLGFSQLACRRRRPRWRITGRALAGRENAFRDTSPRDGTSTF